MLFCIPSAYGEEPLDIGAMLPQSKSDEQPPPATTDPAASEKPKPRKAAKPTALPLAGIKDFDRFQSAFAQLSKSEQFGYVVYPFILQTRVEGSGDGKDQTLRQSYPAEPGLRARTRGWKSLLSADGYGSLIEIESGFEKVVACSGRKGKDCRYTFEFVWRNNCWRLQSIKTNESGI